MERNASAEVSFWDRLGLAWRVLFDAGLARRLAAPEESPQAAEEATLPPERVHASALQFLATLQREGRFVDFLQQDVAGFTDEDVGAAARVVHSGCRKVLQQCLEFEPALASEEGNSVRVPAGFDAQRIRLTGNVTGQPPFQGTLRHRGWVARAIRLPQVSEALDPRVIAAAEVELT